MSRTHSHTKLSLAIWFSALALAFGAQQMSATVTYYVGSCKLGFTYSTIQAALDASPAPNIVEVCPGQYAEQLTITKPVTIEGITGTQNPNTFGGVGNGSLAQIVLPGDYGVNASVDAGGGTEPAIAQVYVNHVSGGAVNLTNLQVNGQGFGMSGFFIGILFNQSSGTINQVITAAQNANGGTGVAGVGIWIQGGSSLPSVTVENSSVHDFNGVGILGVGETAAPDLTLTVKNNVVISDLASTNDVVAEEGTNFTASGNVVSGGLWGILTLAPAGSITGNTVLGSQVGIGLAADGASVTANNVFGTVSYGIDVTATTLKKSIVENNKIRTVTENTGGNGVTGTGIELHCNNISSSLVNSNVIMDANFGYGDALAAFAGSNTYLGVISNVGPCGSGAVSKKAGAALRLKLPGQSQQQ